MQTAVGEPIPGTALVLDIRGFTTEMSSTVGDAESRYEFLSLLSAMNGAICASAELALPPDLRPHVSDLVHVGSTGDGGIVVFLHPDEHYRHAMVAAILLRAAMRRTCEAYSERHGRPLEFGIGVESGTVREVGARGAISLSTYIGECINSAARVEAITKEIHRTDLIFCSSIVALLTEALFGANYPKLMRATAIPAGSISDAEYLELERRMVELNRKLCLNYLHMHVLRGFPEPMALFRLSKSSAALGNPRFDRLLTTLCSGDDTWLQEVRASL